MKEQKYVKNLNLGYINIMKLVDQPALETPSFWSSYNMNAEHPQCLSHFELGHLLFVANSTLTDVSIIISRHYVKPYRYKDK